MPTTPNSVNPTKWTYISAVVSVKCGSAPAEVEHSSVKLIGRQIAEKRNQRRTGNSDPPGPLHSALSDITARNRGYPWTGQSEVHRLPPTTGPRLTADPSSSTIRSGSLLFRLNGSRLYARRSVGAENSSEPVTWPFVSDPDRLARVV